MNYIVFLISFFLSLSIQGQELPAIKIYLEDAYNGKNICDAKVTLEGFEIPAITGKYDKKEKYYYFNEIPTGYNTVMAYHKKYNEKGFQDAKGLPKDLKIKMYDPRFVSYNFEIPALESFSGGFVGDSKYIDKLYEQLKKENAITNKNFLHLYNEDPYHIAIISKYDSINFFSNESTKSLLKELSLEQTLYNGANCYGLNILGLKKSVFDCGKFDLVCDYFVFFFHKKDKTKFERYNCKEIKVLRNSKFTVAVLSNKVIEYYANAKFKKKSLELFYEQSIGIEFKKYTVDNQDFGLFRSPYQLFVSSDKKYQHFLSLRENGRNYNQYGYPDDSLQTLFFLIPKEATNSNVGLGGLDIDYISEKDFYNKNNFFNALYKIDLGIVN